MAFRWTSFFGNIMDVAHEAFKRAGKVQLRGTRHVSCEVRVVKWVRYFTMAEVLGRVQLPNVPRAAPRRVVGKPALGAHPPEAYVNKWHSDKVARYTGIYSDSGKTSPIMHTLI